MINSSESTFDQAERAGTDWCLSCLDHFMGVTGYRSCERLNQYPIRQREYLPEELSLHAVFHASGQLFDLFSLFA